jgi:hypothetical protein
MDVDVLPALLAARLDTARRDACDDPARELELDGGDRQMLDADAQSAAAAAALDLRVLRDDATEMVARMRAGGDADRERHDRGCARRERHLPAGEVHPGAHVTARRLAREIDRAARLAGRRVDRVQECGARRRAGVHDPHLVGDDGAALRLEDEIRLGRRERGVVLHRLDGKARLAAGAGGAR